MWLIDSYCCLRRHEDKKLRQNNLRERKPEMNKFISCRRPPGIKIAQDWMRTISSNQMETSVEVVADHSSGARADRAGTHNIRPPDRRERGGVTTGLTVYHQQSLRMDHRQLPISSNSNPSLSWIPKSKCYIILSCSRLKCCL